MGIVYHARDPIINRRVALKTITTGLADNPGLLERFYREAQSAGGLQHPNIVTIYDMGEASGIPYIAMEFIEGESLEIIIAREDKLPIPLKLSYAMQGCRALDYAHKRGIVHRDIKPANLMVNKEGVVKVVDFGIARVLEASKTQTGMLIGTFAYMSPEQYEGMHADERSDIWSFGVLLYELLAGKRPFSGATPASVMHSICHSQPQPISTHVPDCPSELQTVMDKVLMKSPVERYQSMEDLLLDLDPIFKALQAATVSQRITEANQLFGNGEFTPARDLLKQALQIDSSNVTARSLLEKVNGELKRIVVRPRAQGHVDRGNALLSEGKIQEAKAEAEASLQLDSRFEPALSLQHRVLEELERWQIVADLLEGARQKLAEGAPEQAEASLLKLLEIDPKNREARALQEQTAKEKSVRDRRLHMLQTLQQARSCWTQQEYAKCIQILQVLQKEFPQEEEISRLLETAREDQAEQQKRQNLAKARELLAANKYAECKLLLSELSEQFPQDTNVSGLLNECAAEEQNQIRRQGLKQARTLLAARRYDECVARIEALRKDFPNDEEVERLAESVEGARKEDQLSRELAAARELLAVRKYSECAVALQTLARQFPGNHDVTNLLAVLQQEEAEQRRLAGLAEARKMFVSKRHEDAISLLTKLQAEFPEDHDQISKLLQSARAGLSEQQKEKKLSEARSLLATEKFSEAKALLEELHHLHPDDTGVQKLQRLATSEEQGQAKRKRLQQQWDELRQLASQKNYAEAAARAEKLLLEFPGEADLKRFLDFAKSHQAQAERETRLKSIVADVKRLVSASRWQEATKAAKSGLSEFPGNPELLSASEQAQTELRKQQTKRSIEQRMRDIKVKINREKFSEAVDLAKETLATFGPDTDVTQLLNSAEVELQARNHKRKNQQAKLDSVQRLIRERKWDEATATLAAAIDAAILEPSDQRVAQAWSEIKTQGTVQPAAPVAPGAPPALTKEYALLQGPPVEPEPAIAEPEMQATQLLNAPVSTGSTSNAEATPAIEEKTDATPLEVPKQPETVQQQVRAEMPASVPVQPQRIPDVSRKLPAPPSRIAEAKPPDPIPKAPLAAAAAVAVAILLWAGIHFYPHREATPAASVTKSAAVQPPATPKEDPIEAEQKSDMAQADKRVAANDLEGAIALLGKAAGLNGPLTGSIQQKQAGLEAALKDAGLRKIRQNEEALWQQGTTEVDSGNFRDAESKFRKILALPDGATRKDKAREYLDSVIPQRKMEEKLFASARQSASKNDAGSLQAASQLSDQVIALGGPRKSDAQQLKSQIAARLSKIADANKLAQQQRTAQQIADLQLSARSSMKAGDFSDARRKADQIKQLGADSSALASEIDQAEKTHAADSAFQSALQRYRQSNSSDQNALQAARQNFQSIAESGGPHANDARNYANDISQKLAKLTAAPAPSAAVPPSVSTADTDAIKALLDRYAQAFDNRNADAVREVWPTMSSKIYSGYKNAFQNASAINLQINNSDVSIAPDRSSATVNAMVTQDYTPKRQAMKSITTPYVFQFSKKNGNWVITAVK